MGNICCCCKKKDSSPEVPIQQTQTIWERDRREAEKPKDETKEGQGEAVNQTENDIERESIQKRLAQEAPRKASFPSQHQRDDDEEDVDLDAMNEKERKEYIIRMENKRRSWIRRRAWALENACKNDDVERAKTILNLLTDAKEKEETINAHSGSLYWSAFNGNLDLVKFLVSNGAKVNLAYGRIRALHGAVENGHEDVVEFLIDEGAAVGAGGDPGGANALRTAIKARNARLVRLLLSAGAEMDQVDDQEQKTALELAQESGLNEIVDILIEHRAKINRNATTTTSF